jgi:sugar phosphate isomerase/epimerase
MADPARLSFHMATTLPQWNFAQAVEGAARHGIRAVGVWREHLQRHGIAAAARLLRDAGVVASGLSFAGLVASPDAGERAAALEDSRRALDEAAAIGAPCVVFLAGPVDPRDKSLAATRARALESVAALVPHARASGVKLALEPLHPMACATRTVLSDLTTANDWCDALAAEDAVGIAVDSYALWWDPRLAAEMARAGRRIAACHVNDWLVETTDLRLDRGMMGDGVIDLPGFRAMVDAAGYDGFIEVEILSARDWWRRDPDEVVRVVKERFLTAV